MKEWMENDERMNVNWENDGFIQKSLWQFVFSTLTEFEYGNDNSWGEVTTTL